MDERIKNILEWGYCVIIAIGLALLVRYYIGTPTIVQQPSMNNTLYEGERLILSRWVRTTKGTYNRGDIVTFEAPTNNYISAYKADVENPVAEYNYEPQGWWKKFTYRVLELNKVSYIKRVIGVAGDHVLIQNGKVFVNNEEIDEPYLAEGVKTENKVYSDIIVPEGYVFVMGDNREHSADSRMFGCIPLQKVESKVWIRFWPLSKFGKVN